MSDERIRKLERRFKESGSVEDEAAWLSERVRVGDLDPAKLELAACLGHGAAVAVVPPDIEPLWGDWVYRLGIGDWGRECSLRTYVSLVETGRLAVDREPFEAAFSLILCPCDEEHLCEACGAIVTRHEWSWDEILHSFADPLAAEQALRHRHSLRDELVPWALGYGDPVRSRVQVREGQIKIRPEDPLSRNESG